MSNNHKDKIKEIFDKSERIGVIGSPSRTTELSVDILGTAVGKRLVGNLCIFNYMQDGKDHYALGQIVEVGMRNVWAEDPTMRSLIRQRGSVEPVTERQDYHYAKMSVSSVFSVTDETEPSILGTVPSTGTSVRLMAEEMMSSLLSELKAEFTFLGYAYGTRIKLPMWFKHFGQGKGGAGEAYHIGVFGKTGSGKSVLSKMMIMGYAANKPMTIFVLDPQGEFTKLKKDSKLIPLFERKFQKKIQFIGIQDLVLSGDDLFRRILIASPFLREIGIVKYENRSTAAGEIQKILKGKNRSLTSPKEEVKPSDYYKRENFNAIWQTLQQEEVIKNIYSGKEGQERVRNSLKNSDVNDMYSLWSRICKLFSYGDSSTKVKIDDLTGKLRQTEIGEVIVVDLSEGDVPKDLYWNEDISKIVINEFLKSLVKVSEEMYREDRLLNSLLVIDEAHRLAPRDIDQEDEIAVELKATIIDGIRTTRKYGLGWMFISQTLSGIDREIINQIRAYVFGYGLAYGIERQSLKEIIGGSEEAFNLYQLFKDPQSGFGAPEYSFMSFGPISPLSFSGSPLFFTSLNFPSEFLAVNFNERGKEIS
jgi:hypothetical protein